MVKKVTPKTETKKARTYVAIVLDKSGSMAGTQQQTITGYNEQVQQLREDSKDTEIFVSLVTFNGSVFEHFWNMPAGELQDASLEDYCPGGNTAMNDAVGWTIQKLLDTTDAENEENAYLIVTITDGMENSSHHYSDAALKELQESVQKTGRWTLTYMGHNKAYLEQRAKATSVPISNMAVWDNSTGHKATRGLHQNRVKLASYLSNRKEGMAASLNYHSNNAGIADYSEDIVDEANLNPVDWNITPNVAGVNVPMETGLPLSPGGINITGISVPMGTGLPLSPGGINVPTGRTVRTPVLHRTTTRKNVFGTAEAVKWNK